MKKVFFVLAMACAVSFFGCKDDEKNCIDCLGQEICEGDEYEGETVTAEDLETIKAACDLFGSFGQ